MSGTWAEKTRFEYCLDQTDRKLRNNVFLPEGWSDFFYHVGSSCDGGSSFEGCLIASVIVFREGRQTCFVTAVDPVW